MWDLIYIYRFGNWFSKKNVPIIPKLCKLIIRIFFNSAVDPETEIGKNCVFAYGGIGVVVHKRTKIGNNVIIGQNVTIGGKSKIYDVPIIGDNVYIGPGVRILGNIHIGNEVIIGANCVVITDVPANSIVAGIPGKIIKNNIIYSEYV